MNKNRIASLIFLCTGIYGFIFSRRLSMGDKGELGAGMFPFCISILLIVSGALWFINGKKRSGDEESIKKGGFIKDSWVPIKIIIVTTAFVLALNTLGYVLASSLFLFFLFFWIGRYKIWVAVGLAALLGIASWSFFVKVLAIQLPPGFWA